MNADEPAGAKEFREEARTWLRANVPGPRPTDGDEMRAFDVAWQRIQYQGGWAGISWPKEHGGRGLSLIEQMIWAQEYALADGPYAGCCYVGINHGGPTLIVRGTSEQQAEHLPRILKGDALWCQGFSEPEAGSDLAYLRTSAVIDGDHLVVNGQKIWTSYGHFADYQELLLRTNPSEKHRGITWAICDMKAPGVEVRPIKSMGRHSHFCQCFYTDVRVPLSSVVGGLNEGWSVAQTTFSFERGTGFIAEQIELGRTVERLIEIARTAPRINRDDMGLPIFERLAMVRAEVTALGAMAEALVSRVDQSLEGGGVMLRVFHSELVQRVYRLAIEVLGPERLRFQSWGSHNGWTGAYLRAFSATIGGGTTDIARNIIAERLLGLPRVKASV
jgi:alkylation response protein AidB-like acyl-CoA dehydrogenase